MINLPDLSNRLQELPSLIAREAEIVEKARLSYDISIADYDRLEAKTALLIKAQNPITQSELKYRVCNDEEVYTANLETIKKESEYRRREIDLKKLNDEFISMRKISEIKIKELRVFSE